MTNDIKTRKIYLSIADKLTPESGENINPSEIDGDEFAEKFTLEELVIFQKEIAKAISRKVLG